MKQERDPWLYFGLIVIVVSIWYAVLSETKSLTERFTDKERRDRFIASCIEDGYEHHQCAYWWKNGTLRVNPKRTWK